jgi:hypothetical protein
MIRVPTQPPRVSCVLAALAAPILLLIQLVTKMFEPGGGSDGEAQDYG